MCSHVWGSILRGFLLCCAAPDFYASASHRVLCHGAWHRVSVLCCAAPRKTVSGDCVCVCNLVFLYRYMRPEGPWQRQLFPKDLFLSPIEMINPSGATLSLSSHVLGIVPQSC